MSFQRTHMPDMGIEFTSLDQVTRKRLQQQVETIAVECLKSAQTQKSGKLGFAAERTRFDVIQSGLWPRISGGGPRSMNRESHY